MEMKDYLTRVLRQERLSREETKDILTGITRDAYPAEQITALLTAIQMRGVTVDELLGFRDGILERPFSYIYGISIRLSDSRLYQS